jgi:predicted transcriptional regulator
MTELTVDRVRSVINTTAPSLAVADYIRLLDLVGFEEITAANSKVAAALQVDSPNTLSRRLNNLYIHGLATRKRVVEHRRGRTAYGYTLLR